MKVRSNPRKYLFPLSVRLKMAAAKRGKKLSLQHKRNIARGVRAYFAKLAVARG